MPGQQKLLINKKELDVRYKKQLGCSRKNPNRGVEDMEFPGVPIKEKARGISKGDQEKIMWNFHESLFLTLEFLRKGSNTILWNIQGLSFVLSGISRDKVKKVKIPGQFSQKFSPPPPPVAPPGYLGS